MASLPQLQPDATMARAAVSSQPLQPQPTAALALSFALSAGALTPVQQASVPLQSGQLPLLVAAGGSAASGSGVGSDTGIPRTPASGHGVVNGTGSSAGTGAVDNSPRPASAGVPVASESDSRTLLAEYWFWVGKLQGQQARMRFEVDRLEKIAQRASGDVAAKNRRSRRILLEAYKRCTVEPGSAEAANYPISGNAVKLMRAVDACLKLKASARAAAAAPTPGLPEDGAAEPPPAFVCPITQDVMSDPVVAADGHTYERGMIEKWVRQGLGAGASGPGSSGPRSPMTNEPLPNTALVPNLALRSAIKEWQEQRERQRLQQQQQQRVQQQQQQHQQQQRVQQGQQQQQEQQRLQQGQQGMQRTGSRQLPDVA